APCGNLTTFYEASPGRRHRNPDNHYREPAMLLGPSDPLELPGALPPVVALASVLPRGYSHAAHSHRRARLTYTDSGVMTVFTPQGNWIVPPKCAVWIPAGAEHRIHARDDLDKRSIDVDPAAIGALLQNDCAVVQVSPLLRELTNVAARFSRPYPASRREERVASLICDEIAETRLTSMFLPLPRDARALRVAQALMADLSNGATIEQWGLKVGASARTLARVFVRETGLPFAAWRKQARLLDAVSRLADGESVSAVAARVGYEHPSSFTAMFRSALGAAPTRYFSSIEHEE
ncbi:helix-turn-helix transcriptional regulator, partial [Caballeronia mineralivorans]|uniref:AraC family transcriptional regulator n=2 Tax=Caballeronia mineralivorans TaxID=2010198 RepID=UPI002AFE3E63